jgi:hypothetical protein
MESFDILKRLEGWWVFLVQKILLQSIFLMQI